MKAVPKSSPEAARAAYVRWLEKEHPAFYAQIRQAAGLGDVATGTTPTSAGNIFTNIINGATNLLSQYVASKEKLAQLKENTKRAKAGLPPLTGQPVEFQQPSFFQSVPPWAWVLGGVGVLWLVMKD
jgi:negative regulator of sigma E activity